jgi:hypothetical protein
MRCQTRFLGTAAAVLTALILSFTTNAQARPADLMIDAYANLVNANHDYEGHRVNAMKHIEAAAKDLGIDLHGSARVHQRQGESDAQMRDAKHMLEDARTEFAERDRRRIESHLTEAIHEINLALKIK